MTTAIHQKPPAKAAVPKPPAVLYQGFVPIANIDVVSNVRKKFNPAKLQELTDSVRDHGVNTPVELRPGKERGRYDLVAGHRRLKVAQAVGLTQIPAIVKDTTPEQAAVDQVIENIQREELEPMDEARGFQVLLQLSKDGKTPAKYSREQLAQLVDKSVAYVYRSMALLELPEKVIKAIEANEITPAHGHQLLRVPADQRVKVFTDWKNNRNGETARSLGEFVDYHVGRDLNRASFPKDRAYANEIACTACPMNSANQGMLFDGAQGGKCMLRTCFDKKSKQHFEDRVEEAKKKHPDAGVVETSHYIYEGKEINGFNAVAKHGSREAASIKNALIIVHDGEIWVGRRASAAKKSKSSSSSGVTDRRSPKEAFIDRWIELELFKELAKTAKLDKMIERIAEDLCCSYWSNSITARFEALELDPELATECVEKAKTTEEKIRLLYKVVLCKNTPYGGSDNEAEKVGIDAKVFDKKHQAAAEDAWTNRRAKKA